jgi:hypothetical protein
MLGMADPENPGQVTWGQSAGPANTVWGHLDAANIVWGVSRNIVWGVSQDSASTAGAPAGAIR